MNNLLKPMKAVPLTPKVFVKHKNIMTKYMTQPKFRGVRCQAVVGSKTPRNFGCVMYFVKVPLCFTNTFGVSGTAFIGFSKLFILPPSELRL